LSGSPLLKECRICGPKQLARTLSSPGEGHRFICRLGVRNYWLSIRVRGETLGIAYLQALDHPAGGTSARRKSPRFHQANATVMSRLRFIGAARFLRLIVQHVETATLSDLRKADLTNAGHALLALEREQARLHEVLQGHLPAAPQALRRRRPESQAEQLVHRLAGRLELDYAKPVTLQQYAREMGMNAAYLSALFSRVVGISFKAYLTDLRLEKAKALLGDPTRTASEVSSAVGYASENRFRSAFKQATGLSPRYWRETMQTDPPQVSSSSS
jgi:AraC-like DNA-binding protein